MTIKYPKIFSIEEKYSNRMTTFEPPSFLILHYSGFYHFSKIKQKLKLNLGICVTAPAPVVVDSRLGFSEMVLALN